jgi:putative Mg2+ transporter-C (MgtC) family protein
VVELTEWEGLLRVTLAAILGACIGVEREIREKQAGLRTNMLVSMGAALFTVSSLLLAAEFMSWEGAIRLDPARMLSTVISGVGFLGGAVIFRTEQRIRGVTTAASIWAVTGVGIAAGAGLYITAIGATILTVIVLFVFAWIEHRVGFKEGSIKSTIDDDI